MAGGVEQVSEPAPLVSALTFSITDNGSGIPVWLPLPLSVMLLSGRCLFLA